MTDPGVTQPIVATRSEIFETNVLYEARSKIIDRIDEIDPEGAYNLHDLVLGYMLTQTADIDYARKLAAMALII